MLLTIKGGFFVKNLIMLQVDKQTKSSKRRFHEKLLCIIIEMSNVTYPFLIRGGYCKTQGLLVKLSLRTMTFTKKIQER